MMDEEVDRFRPSRSAIKLGERAGVGRATGVDTGLKSSRSRRKTSLEGGCLSCWGFLSFALAVFLGAGSLSEPDSDSEELSSVELDSSLDDSEA